MKRKLLFFFLLAFIFFNKGFGQIIIPVNLSAAKDTSVTISSNRSGSYCGDNNCVVFVVTLNPGSDLLSITPSQFAASNFYTVNCGPQTPIGTPTCVSGLTTANIAFCKPGNNTISFTITASTAVHASGDLILRQGCTGAMSVTGLNAASITWTSVYPGAAGAYNSYLSCASGCTTTNVSPAIGAPAYIDYKVSGIVTNCANTKTDTVRVYTVPAMTVAVTPANPVICAGGSGNIILTATPTGGNPPYTYLWSTGQTTQSISVNSIGTYSVSVSDNTTGCSAIPQSVTVTAAPTPAAPTAAGTIICANSTATLTATAPGGTYQWYNSASGGTLLVTNASYTTPVLTSTTTYYVQTTVGGCVSPRTPVVVTVNPIPAAPTVASTSTCNGSSATLTATAPGGTYEWYNAASGGTLLNTGSVYTTPTLTVNTTYYVQTTVNGCTGPRTAVTVNIIPTPVAPTAAGTSTCSGTAVTLTATAPGGNYDWYDSVSGGTLLLSGATYTTPILTATTTYYVQTTVNGCISARTPVTVTVNAIPAAPTVSSATICNGTTATLTATAPGGTYQWYDSASGGTLLTTGTTYTSPALTASTTYYVQTVINGCVSARTAVNVTVNPVTAAPTALGTTICSGSTAALTATAPGGTYDWFSAPSGGSSLFTGATYTTPALITTTTYYVQATVNGCTGARTAVTVTVSPTPVAPTAAGTAICSGTTAALTATAPGGTYDWYDSASGGTLLSTGAGFTTPVLTATTVYYVQTTVNGCVSARTAVNVTVNPLPAAPTASGSTICQGSTATLTATAPGGTYNWYSTASGGTSLFTGAAYTTPALLTTTTYYVDATSVSGCTGPRAAVTVTVTSPANPAFFYSSGTFCISGSNQTPTVVSPSGGTFSSTTGLVFVDSGTSINSTTGEINVGASTPDTYTITFVTNTTCAYSSSSSITITNAPDATFSYSGPYCKSQANPLPTFPPGSSAGIFSCPDPALVFLNTSTGEIDMQLSAPGTYTVTNNIVAAFGCAAASATNTVTISPVATVNAGIDQIVCSGLTVALNGTIGGSATSATWSGGTGFFSPASSPVTTYTLGPGETNVTLTLATNDPAGPCGAVSDQINIIVNPTPTVTSAASAITCNNTAQNYTITGSVSGTTFSWGRATVAGISNVAVSGQTAATITESLVNTTSAPINVIYSIVPSANGCDGPAFTYTVTVNPTPTVTSAASAITCNNIAQNYTITGSVSGTTFSWSRAAVAGISNVAVSGQTVGTITESLVNTTAAPINVIYTIVPSANGCDGPAFTYTVTVNPTPTVTSAASAITCNNIAQNYTITGSVSGTTFSWGRATVAGISNVAVSGQTAATITESLVNTTSAPINVIYTIVPSANGCDGPAFTYTVTVNPTPTVTSAASAITCNNTAQNYTITGSVSGTTFSWSRATVAGISNVAVSGQTNNIINEVLTNTTNTAVSVTYNIVPSANGCDGPAFTYTVTVNPTPTVTSAASAITCNNIAQNYTITGSVSGTTFSWSRAAVAGISNVAVSGQTAAAITESLVNTTSAPINVIYAIVPSANGCGGPAFTYTVTVNPTPTVTSAASAITCNNTAQNYTITGSVSGTTFTWSRATVAGISNGAVSAQTAGTITESLVNTTAAPINVIYTIVPSANGCDGPAFTYTVTVNPTPTVTSAASAAICNSTAQNYIITSSVSGANYTWSRAATAGIGNAPVLGQTSNTIAETLVNTTVNPIDVIYIIFPEANGCTGPTFTYTVTVNPTPRITSSANALICNNTAQNYTITSNISGTTYTWSRAAIAGISNAGISGQTVGTITESLVNTTSAPINVIYTIIPLANGCSGPVFNYTVTVNPTPTVTSAASAITCNNTAQNYTITGSVSGTTFSWDRATVAGISNVAVSGQTAGTITESLVNTTSAPINVIYTIVPSANGCDGPAFTYTVTVNPTPTVTSAASAITCNNIAQNYTITGSVSGTTFSWSRATVAGISNGAVSAQTAGTITESLVNTTAAPINVIYTIVPSANGCDGPAFTYTVTVNPTPTVTSAASAITCNNTAQNYSITGSVSGTTFSWSRAAVAGISDIAVSGQTAATITESLVNTTAAPINVIYTIVPSANGCDGPAFTYTVTVNPTPTVTNSFLSQIVCSGGINSVVSFTSNVTGVTFNWSATATPKISGFITSGTGNIPPQTLLNSDITKGTITYIVTPYYNGCPGTPSNYDITVNPKPVTPIPSSNSPVCQNYTLSLTTPTIAGASYTWTGPNGFTSNAQNPVINNVSLAAAGSYSLSITVDGCTSNIGNVNVAILPTPSAPVATSNSPLCFGNTLVLNANNIAGATYNWTGPNGFTSTLRNPSLTNTSAINAGIYSVTATVNGCTSVAGTTNVVVNAIPIAPTATSNSPVCENNTINLSVTNTPGTIYTWTGPNNFSSTLPNPSISAAGQANAGTYTVTATVGGCTGPPTSVVVQVDATPINPIATSNSPVCTGYPITLTASTFAGAVYKWTGPNGFSSTLQNPIINSAVSANAGVYTVSITAPGCLVTASTNTTVIVNQTPIAPTADSNSPVCLGDNLKLTASGIAGATYNWTGPNGFTSTLQNPVVNNMTANTAGTYSVTVTLNSCTSAVTTTNVVYNRPKVAVAGNDQVVCANNSKVTLTGSIIGDTNSGIWTSTGTGVFLPDNTSLFGSYMPSAADIAAGGITLTLTTTNNGSCGVSSSSFKVTITPTPVVNAGGNRSLCVSEPAINIPGSVINATGGKWTTSGTGSFAPSVTDVNVNYIPSEADKAKGSVVLKLTSISNSCLPVADSMILAITPSPTINMPDFKYILQGESYVINPTVTGTNLQYLWTPNLYLSSATIRNPTVKGVESQLYNLAVTGLSGCVTQKQIMIYVLKPIVIPNTFTPNGDGINDLWIIKELSTYPGAQVSIFNRYGTRLYYSKGYGVPWDGTYNGKPLPFGTYYYIVDCGIYGPRLSGYIALVR